MIETDPLIIAIVSAAVGGIVGSIVGYFSNLLLHRRTRKIAQQDELVDRAISIQSLATKFLSTPNSIPEVVVITLLNEFKTKLNDYGEEFSSTNKIKHIETEFTKLWGLITGGNFVIDGKVDGSKRIPMIQSRVQCMISAIRSS